MFWGRRKRAEIPLEIRDELESHGVIAIQVALTHPQDVPNSPLHSLRHEHRQYALAWLSEKRQQAERRHRFIVVGIWAGIVAAIASVIAAWPIAKAWLN
jgi:hypothetical protein